MPRTIRLPSTCHLIRDTQESTQRFVQTKRRQQVMHYFLALKQAEYQLELHQWIALPTESHLVYSDHGETVRTALDRQAARRTGRLAPPSPTHPNDEYIVPVGPSFYEDLHARWAEQLNKMDRVAGKVVGDQQCPLVMVKGALAEIETIAELRVKPTTLGIVVDPYDYPGFGFGMGGDETFEDELVHRIERPREVSSKYPEVVFATYRPPAALQDLPREWVKETIRRRIKELTQEAISERGNQPFVGLQPTLSADPLETRGETAERRRRARERRHAERVGKRALEHAPSFAEKRKARINAKTEARQPRVKTCDPKLEREEIAWINAFLDQYTDAIHKQKRQTPGALFPKGVYKVALYCGANVDMR